ncbi:MAG: hypothetical protein MUF15_02110 [Acidobacteria bacterium]|jgi:hypothetical protein|nr:hypothetical protein [Acidobacteriota bacterium]
MKKIHILSISLLCILGIGHIYAGKLATLNQVINPNGLAVTNSYIYVLEEPTIYIYSAKDFQLVKKFGKKGEGPQEFMTAPFGFMPMILYPYDNGSKLLVNSNSKVSFFTADGTFIKEVRVSPMQVFLPLNDIYISTGSGESNKKEQIVTINLYDKNFQCQKEIYKSDMVIGANFNFNYPLTPFSFWGYKDKIYIASAKDGFVILVFDKTGKLLHQLKKDYKPLKVTAEYKKKTLDFYKNNPQLQQLWEFFKDRISFKEYYPPIRDMLVRDDKIYVLSYYKKGDESECIILDLNGKELKRIFVPLPENYGDSKYIYDIADNCFFSLVENEEEENWELHKKVLN